MILLFFIIFIIYNLFNSKENFSEYYEDENYYQYCLQNFNLTNCVPDEKCLNFGFKKICS